MANTCVQTVVNTTMYINIEIMLFDVVSIEKDAKDKDIALRKISYVISSQWRHFGA